MARPVRRPKTPSGWDLGPRLRATLYLGSVIGFFVGLGNLAGGIQIGGDDGMILPGWVCVILAPLVIYLTVLWGRLARLRYQQRMQAWMEQQQ